MFWIGIQLAGIFHQANRCIFMRGVVFVELLMCEHSALSDGMQASTKHGAPSLVIAPYVHFLRGQSS